MYYLLSALFGAIAIALLCFFSFYLGLTYQVTVKKEGPAKNPIATLFPTKQKLSKQEEQELLRAQSFYQSYVGAEEKEQL